MDTINRLLSSLTESLGPYAPRVIGAAVILALAWLGARLARAAARNIGARTRLDERAHHPGLTDLLANIAGGLIWLLALPALLGTLALTALLEPVNAMLSRLLGFLPNLIGALVILGVGLLVAGIVRQIISGVLQAAGSERIAERLGLSAALGKNTLAGIAASVMFALLLLPTLAAALEALRIEAVARPVSQLLEKVFELIPKLISAAILLGVAALIGRALSGVASGVLAGLGLDRLPAQLGLKAAARPGARSASEVAGQMMMWAVMFVALTQACEVIGLSVLTEAVATLGAALARVAVAALLWLAGMWLAARAAQWLRASQAANAAVLAWVAQGAILYFAGALALRQAGLPAEIVTIAFAAVIGAVAIALAVAVGVGGRHVAARLVDRAAKSFEPAPADDAERRDA